MKKYFLIILLCVLGYGLQAQEVYNSSGRRDGYKRNNKSSGFDPSRLVLGGGLGLSFGNATSIAVAPIIGYRFTDNFAAGIGLGYQYVSVKDFWEIWDPQQQAYDYYPYRASLFSGSVWARHIIWDNIFAHAEFEYDIQRYRNYYIDDNPISPTYATVQKETISYNSPALLLGGGYRQRVTDNSSVVFMVLYDVIQDKYSPYRDRVDFRIGFNLGW